MTRLVDRAVAVGRWTTAAPDGPPAAAALLGVLAAVEVAQRGGLSPARLSSTLLLGLLATAPLALVRGHELAVASTVAAATFLTLAIGQRPTAAGLLAPLVALFLVGLRRPRRVSVLLLVPFLAYAAVPYGAGDPAFRVLLLGAAAAALGLGVARRTGGEAVARDASDRAVADSLLEHAARGERARIARELHDVVAHHISMIAVQAETARLTTPGLPGEGATRLLAIGDTARQALTEMRRLLGVLREDAGPTAARQPQPGLEQLNDLVDEARDAAAASTRLIVRGAVVPLDPGLELTAYRLVQEALTNARRHAPGAAVDVELHYTADVLHLRVRDSGPGRSTPDGAAGHGLLGMRERAATVGGTLHTGPAPAGGFLVEAALPMGPR
ncbi:MAG TPA: sensor histidine kinase [Mycobacteriales bacterium]|nr:sensor histidine kinase [Mycobacteriales bacterium]